HYHTHSTTHTLPYTHYPTHTTTHTIPYTHTLPHTLHPTHTTPHTLHYTQSSKCDVSVHSANSVTSLAGQDDSSHGNSKDSAGSFSTHISSCGSSSSCPERSPDRREGGADPLFTWSWVSL